METVAHRLSHMNIIWTDHISLAYKYIKIKIVYNCIWFRRCHGNVVDLSNYLLTTSQHMLQLWQLTCACWYYGNKPWDYTQTMWQDNELTHVNWHSPTLHTMWHPRTEHVQDMREAYTNGCPLYSEILAQANVQYLEHQYLCIYACLKRKTLLPILALAMRRACSYVCVCVCVCVCAHPFLTSSHFATTLLHTPIYSVWVGRVIMRIMPWTPAYYISPAPFPNE